VIEHYEKQSDEEAVAEDEGVYDLPDHTMMSVPSELVPVVRGLIAQHKSRKPPSR
jgi:hypothetical protein